MRAAVVTNARALSTHHLSAGTSGNVSVRWQNGFLITPSALPYPQTEPHDIVYVGLDGRPIGSHRPSSEWRIHRDIYIARPDAGAVIHAHAAFATTLACHERRIPPFHYMVAAAGGDDIRCAPYATFGTAELSAHVLAAMQNRRACLLANHGLVAAGASLDQALAIAVEVEALCEMYWRCLQIDEPYRLTDEEMTAVIDQFNRGYGAGPALRAGRTSATD